MQFDTGTWWLVAGSIAVMIAIIGTLVSVMAKFIVINPLADLKSAIDLLIVSINELRTFVELQKSQNANHQSQLTEIFSEIDRHDLQIDEADGAIATLKNDVEHLKGSTKILFKEIGKAFESNAKHGKDISEIGHKINNIKQVCEIKHGNE